MVVKGSYLALNTSQTKPVESGTGLVLVQLLDSDALY